MTRWLLNSFRLAKMSSKTSNRDHLYVTANQSRESMMCIAKVVRTSMLSSTVKGVSLKIENSGVQFKAGQWVDFFVPDLPNFVGGYSICSGVEKLNNDRVIDLAVKLSDYPTAKWIHEKCEVDCSVNIRIGGDFFYDPISEYCNCTNRCHDLLLVACGVGINPIFSILQNADYVSRSSSEHFPNTVHLLYSVKTENDLIFKDAIVSICEKHAPRFKCQFFVTKECRDFSNNSYVKKGRIQSVDIIQAVAGFSGERLAFICGPLDMLTFVNSILPSVSFRTENIRYEKWW